jgi:hypothetical protein
MNARKAGGGPIEASVNMWALLADNDPGDSPEAKIYYMLPEVPDAVPNGKPQKRKKKKKRTKKQAKAPAAVANGARRGGSSCVRALFAAAVTAAILAFSLVVVHVSVAAAPAV